MPAPSEKELEHFLHQTLRSLPPRRAPATLEHRVLAALAAHQAKPWYHQSFSHWPLPFRVCFLTLCVSLCTCVLLLGPLGTQSLLGHLRDTLNTLSPLHKAALAVSDSGAAIARSIPSLYIYGALGLFASFYLALVGLGATAYRTLLAHR